MEVTTWTWGAAAVVGAVGAAGLGWVLAVSAAGAAVAGAAVADAAAAGAAAAGGVAAGGASAATPEVRQVAKINPTVSSSCFISEILLE
jgi:hypothetical protein